MAPRAPGDGARRDDRDTAVDAAVEAEVEAVDEPLTPEEVLHDARVELDEWRRSMRMDPLEG